MSQQDSLEGVLASLHEAMLDNCLWDRTSALIDEACRSMGNKLIMHDDSFKLTGVLFSRFCYRGQRHKTSEFEYYNRYFPTDEHVPRLWKTADSQIVHITDLFSEEELKTSPTYNEGMARTHCRNAVKVRLDGPDNSQIICSFGDPVDAGGWSSAQTEMIARLLPHLRQFLRVRYALGEAEALGQSLGALRENRRVGVIELDRWGRIGAANDLALALLRKGDGLFDEHGELHANAPENDRTLQQLVGGAIPPFPVQGVGGSMRVTRPKGITPLMLHVSPVESPDSNYRSQRVAAFVLIVDPRRKARVDPELAATMLGLTTTESEVAVMLAEGRTIQQIAKLCGRERNTVRWHVSQICGKLDVTRQFEVAHSVGAIARRTAEFGAERNHRRRPIRGEAAESSLRSARRIVPAQCRNSGCRGV